MKYCALLCFLLMQLLANSQTLNTISVEVEGIRNQNGNIILSAFKTEEQFEDEEPVYNFVFDKSKLQNGKTLLEIELPEGIWGVTLLDDENQDGEMEYNWIMMPEEGFGFSNFYLEGLSRPDLSDFDFTVQSNENIKLSVRVRYL